MGGKWSCMVQGCPRDSFKGDVIYRVSPKGGPFYGACEEHFAEMQEAEAPA